MRSIESELEAIKGQLNRINSKLNTLLGEAKKKEEETWLKGHDIFQITIWNDKEKLRRAKNYGYVEQKKDMKMGIVYKLESINPHFFLNKQTPMQPLNIWGSKTEKYKIW